MSKCRCYTLREVFTEVFVDKKCDFDQMLLIPYYVQANKCAKPVGKTLWKQQTVSRLFSMLQIHLISFLHLSLTAER